MNPIILQDLLEIENDDFFPRCACPSTGIPVWPAIRNVFFRMIMLDRLYPSQPPRGASRKRAVLGVAGVALRAAMHNFTHVPRRASVMILATGAGLFERDGVSRNRYTLYFSQALGGDAWSIEGLFDYKWPLPREGGRLSFSLPGLAAITAFSRIAVTGAVRRVAEELVERATSRADRLLGWKPDDARREWLVTSCARQVAGYPLKRKWQMHWLERVKPNLLLVEEGCYGHMAVLNAAAREHGVVVAEFQHGLVTGGHDVYNVAPSLEQSEAYRRTLPDYFLGYGSWWNRQFNAPVRKVVIGNPHRSAFLDRRASAGKDRGTILVLGDGVETESYLDFCGELAGSLPQEFKVVFRPHPMERLRVSGSPAGAGRGFQVDREPDIYTSLDRAEIVIAELSTGLFEAVGLARRIFVWNTTKSRFSLPSHPFASFDTVADLVRTIRADTGAGIVSEDAPEEIWASDWSGRFRRFIDGVFEGGRSGMENALPDPGHAG